LAYSWVTYRALDRFEAVRGRLDLLATNRERLGPGTLPHTDSGC
jgi:hypothetical protein